VSEPDGANGTVAVKAKLPLVSAVVVPMAPLGEYKPTCSPPAKLLPLIISGAPPCAQYVLNVIHGETPVTKMLTVTDALLFAPVAVIASAAPPTLGSCIEPSVNAPVASAVVLACCVPMVTFIPSLGANPEPLSDIMLPAPVYHVDGVIEGYSCPIVISNEVVALLVAPVKVIVAVVLDSDTGRDVDAAPLKAPELLVVKVASVVPLYFAVTTSLGAKPDPLKESAAPGST
jgi:hypothetical protein